MELMNDLLTHAVNQMANVFVKMGIKEKNVVNVNLDTIKLEPHAVSIFSFFS